MISGEHGASTLSGDETILHAPTVHTDGGDQAEQVSLPGSLHQEQPSQLASGYLQELEARKAGLETELSNLKVQEKTLAQKGWKVTKMEQPKIDAKLAEIKSKAQKLQRDLEKTTHAALVESETGDFDHRLKARETGEMDGTEQLQSSEVSSVVLLTSAYWPDTRRRAFLREAPGGGASVRC